MVSVASQSPNSPQKSVTLPLNVALGQQILTVQQSATTSPAKAGTSQSTAQVRPSRVLKKPNQSAVLSNIDFNKACVTLQFSVQQYKTMFLSVFMYRLQSQCRQLQWEGWEHPSLRPSSPSPHLPTCSRSRCRAVAFIMCGW